jgi:hypothetical protein
MLVAKVEACYREVRLGFNRLSSIECAFPSESKPRLRDSRAYALFSLGADQDRPPGRRIHGLAARPAAKKSPSAVTVLKAVSRQSEMTLRCCASGAWARGWIS